MLQDGFPRNKTQDGLGQEKHSIKMRAYLVKSEVRMGRKYVQCCQVWKEA